MDACDAMLAGAKDCMHAIEPINRRAAAARIALVAGRRRVVKVEAPSALQEIVAGRRHVTQLRRGSGQDRAGEHEIAIRNERADPQPAIGRVLDAVELQPRDIDQA
jgi:hypothetical protein